MKEYREPSTLKINRTQKKLAKERLQSLGITLEGFVAKAWEFAINAKSNEIYEFMKRWHIKKLLIFLLLAGFLYFFSEETKQIVTAPLEFIDRGSILEQAR